jgi:hypothetical protein
MEGSSRGRSMRGRREGQRLLLREQRAWSLWRSSR